MENELKARILTREIAEGRPPRDGKAALALFHGIKHHRLDELAKRAGVTLNDYETRLLHRLSEQARWAGRYPIPLKATETDFVRDIRESDLAEIQMFITRVRS